MRILIVDDEMVSLVKLQNILAPYGECNTATSGTEAFEMFKKAHDERRPYNLITMDIDMPDMRGYDVVGKIRDWESFYEVFSEGLEAKILMVTALSDNQTILSSFRQGCEDYLIKPFDSQKVAAALEKLGFKKPV